MCMLNHVQLFATPWTAAHQAALSMGFSRQEYWVGALGLLGKRCLWCLQFTIIHLAKDFFWLNYVVSVYQLWWLKSFIPFEYSQPLTLQVLLFAQTLLVFCNSYHKCDFPICSLCFLFILPYFSFLWFLLYSIIFYYSLSKQMLKKCKKKHVLFTDTFTKALL